MNAWLHPYSFVKHKSAFFLTTLAFFIQFHQFCFFKIKVASLHMCDSPFWYKFFKCTKRLKKNY